MTQRLTVLWSGLLVTGLLAGSPAAAQEPSNSELKKEIQALSEMVKSLQRDMQDLKTLLQRGGTPPAPANVVLDIGNSPFRGEKNAPLTMVEFTDYQCPFCGRYSRDTYAEIERDYIATGKVKYVLLNLPLESIHPLAFKAAVAASCAGDQGKYWEMHDRLFENQKTLDAWTVHAESVGLDLARFGACLDSETVAARIRSDMAQAQRAGITGTPGFFIAATDAAGTKVKALRTLKGAQPYAAFKAQLDALLAERDAGGPKTR